MQKNHIAIMKQLLENTILANLLTPTEHQTMTWESRYVPPDMECWKGRADTPNACYLFQIIQPLDLQNSAQLPSPQSAFAVIGFCCDEGIRRNLGRVGAAKGPAAIREAAAKLALKNPQLLCYDAGDITCLDGELEQAQEALGAAIALLLQHNITPIVFGGGHEMAWGHYLGIAKKFPTETMGIVNFDAHFDMRPLPANAQGTSGTPFLQIAQAQQRFDYNCIGIQPASNIQPLFATAKKYGAHVLLAEEIQQNKMVGYKSFVERIIHENQIIYLSLCLDVFAAAYAPGVSAPQALGLTPWQVIPLLRQLVSSGKVVAYDIAELSPPYDIDQRTAKLAASLVYEILSS